ncbi:MAG: butyryl-CoA:acetate CoA-transferase [Peptococcaceae bacterium]|nr:butyryl-CoA:acetate CoA-transferase [Peptococcaceae bacterium]
MGDLLEMYRSKVISADEAAGKVKPGDWVFYSHFAMVPRVLDEALAKRAGELTGVKVRSVCAVRPVKIVQADPEKKSFTYHSGFFGHEDRKLGDKGLCYYISSNYGESPAILREGHAAPPDVAMISTTPMDERGFFNFSVSCSYARAICEKAGTVILEINRNAPRCLGGVQESVHISEVDYIVEGDNEPLFTLPEVTPTEEDRKIALLVAEEIEDGCCLQLGIGGMPNTIGRLIADSDLKDLGVHSEMMTDAFMELFEKGKITGARKSIDRYKMTYTFALGSQRLYDFLHNNPACATYPVDITNSVARIARNDKQIAINNAIEIDLYGQICSESAGFRQISGTGGQLEFTLGAACSRGGKAFICLRSTTTDKEGRRVSRIVPHIRPGGIVTVPRTAAFYVVTEYGKANLKGKPTWQRAEMLINLAHPDYRDELVRQAEKMGIWTKTNKRL